MNYLRRVNRTHAFSFVLLCICIVAFCVISASAATYSGKCGDNLTYTLNTDTGVLTISGTGAMADWSDSNGNVAPWYDYRSSIRTAQVSKAATSIGAYAFYGCSSLTSITIPNRVTSIGGSAFRGCSSLTSISIPDSVTSIGGSAFFKCSGLNAVYITDIAAWCGIAFGDFSASPFCYAQNLYLNGEQVTDLVIPDSVTSIGAYAFYNCSRLTSISIPDSVTSIGDSAFFKCSRLTSISIPSGVTSIGVYAFRNCSSLTSISIPDSVTSIGGAAFWDCSSLTSISIPSGVTSIEGSAFYNCSSLTSISIPDSVTSIGADAFSGCSSLTSISIPSGVTSIGAYAFKDCSSITSISIPSGVTSIEDSAFLGCSSLTNISIPFVGASRDAKNGYDQVLGYIFGYTKQAADSTTNQYSGYYYHIPSTLRNVTVTNAATISKNAFYGCSSLTSISIPSGVTSIERFAFYGCGSLASITIPDSVTSIGADAFLGCSSLTSITILNPDCQIDDSQDAMPSAAAIYGYTNSTAAAYAVKYGRTFVSIGGSCGDKLAFRMDPDTGVLSITGTGAMDSWYLDDSPWYVYRASIRSIRIASGATSIGDFAFDGCSNLTEVVIAETVERIGDGAFDNCTSLAEVAVLNSACTMPTRADAFPASVTIHGFAGSTAEAYATKYNRTFVALDPTSLTAKVSAATYASGTATLRVTATPTVTEGMKVERYGVFFAPAKYADSYATNGQVAVKEGAIASGKPFFADLTDIPESAYDVKIYAWAFVKLVGVSDPVVCPLDPVSIHDIVK